MAAGLVVMNRAKRGLYAGRHIHLGNAVSEDGGNKSRRTWKPSVHCKGIFSRALDQHLQINPIHGLPSIDKAGGVDECLLDIPNRSVPGGGEQFKSVITNFDQDLRKSARRSSSLSSHWKSSRSPILLQALSSGSQKLGIFGVRELKTLKVVLTEEIDGLGRAGQVVGVAPGYARNKLIPHHLALPALDKYVTLVNNQLKFARPHLLVEKEDVKSTETISEEEKYEEIEAALRRLDTGKVVLRRHVSSLSNLQQAVTKEDIVFEVKRQMGVDLAASNVMLPADLTLLGEFEVLLRFPRDLMMPGGKDKLLLKVRIRRK